jgi:hypothetical protein
LNHLPGCRSKKQSIDCATAVHTHHDQAGVFVVSDPQDSLRRMSWYDHRLRTASERRVVGQTAFQPGDRFASPLGVIDWSPHSDGERDESSRNSWPLQRVEKDEARICFLRHRQREVECLPA